jgi:hypothetical protein
VVGLVIVNGPYREPAAALATTPARQLPAPLRRRLFSQQKGLVMLGFAAAMMTFVFWMSLLGGGVLVAFCSGFSVVTQAVEITQRAYRHRRHMHLLEIGRVVPGSVLGRARRALWRGGHILRIELVDGHLVEVFSPTNHEIGTDVRVAYEPGRSEHAFVLEDLPERLRLDGDTWKPMSVDANATPPPSPRS